MGFKKPLSIGVGSINRFDYRRLFCMLGNLNSHPSCLKCTGSPSISSFTSLENKMEKTWVFPKKSFIKINTHAVHYPQPLPNGNDSGLGIVLRDHKGTIILMVSGTIRNVTPRANELWAMLIGLRSAFYEGIYKLQLESDNSEAIKEWEDWHWFIEPNHAGVIQQLLQRSSDPNLSLDKVEVITESQNMLARYLAEEGARSRDRLVAFRRSFGRVRELWRLDMGLGPLDARFMLLEEEEYLGLQAEEEEVQGLGELLAQDEGSANMGLQHGNA